MKIRNVLMVVLGVAMATGAFAAQGSKVGNRQPTFNQFDLNGDGKITRSELSQVQSERIAQRKDGGRQVKNASRAQIFEKLDADDNGSISREEFATYQQQNLRKGLADKAQKGNRNCKERAKGMSGKAAKGGSQSNHTKNSAYKVNGMKGKADPKANRPSFANIDTDGNQVITKAEFTAFHQSRIAQ
jgi:Ca2+-binding EF-hand superfamily protein